MASRYHHKWPQFHEQANIEKTPQRTWDGMVSYECCGVKFRDAGDLSRHMKTQHKMPRFNVELTCCGMAFAEARELIDHVSMVHHYQMKLET